MTCYVCEEEAYDSFKREGLEEASRKKQFHDPKRKTRLKYSPLSRERSIVCISVEMPRS